VLRVITALARLMVSTILDSHRVERIEPGFLASGVTTRDGALEQLETVAIQGNVVSHEHPDVSRAAHPKQSLLIELACLDVQRTAEQLDHLLVHGALRMGLGRYVDEAKSRIEVDPTPCWTSCHLHERDVQRA